MTGGWRPGLFEIDAFELENGQSIAPLQLSYITAGTPEDGGGNTVVFLPTASGVKESVAAYAGADGCFDPGRDFMVAIDAIGGGQSSRPSLQDGPGFAAYSIRDNARAVHRLLTKGLGLDRVKAVGGASMGAMIALELGIQFPDLAACLYLWSPSSRCSAMFVALSALLREIIALDPAFSSGAYSRQPVDGLRAAGNAYFLALVGRRHLDSLTAQQAEHLRGVIGEAFADKWDANDLLSRYRALTTHDVRLSLERGGMVTLGSVKPRCLLMPCPSDHLLPIEDVDTMHRQLRESVLLPLESDLGHWSASQPPGSPEHRFICQTTKAFLDRG